MIKYSIDCVTYNVEQFKFPAGEIGVRLTCGYAYAEVPIKIKAHLKSSDDIMALLLTVDALRRKYHGLDISLTLAYVPYARQDRVCNEGESLSIAIMASLINSCGFSEVKIYDPHSDVTPALINNCTIVDQIKIFRGVKQYWGDTWIVAPDAGAYKKSHKFAEAVNASGVITCNKIRNLKTGKIEGLKCDEDVTGKELLVLDDIAEGSATFVHVANLFGDKPTKIELAITHGIFSKGVDVVSHIYDHIYATNSYHGSIPEEMTRPNITWVIL